MTVAGERAWPTLPREAFVAGMARSLRDDNVLGVIVSGESGSGKTTMTLALARQLDTRDPIRLRGSDLLSATPYGALYGLLENVSEDTFDNSGSVFRALGRVVSERLDGTRRTVIIDNAHLVDELSAHALVQLATIGRIRLIIADSNFANLPDSFLDLWRDGLLVPHVVPPLSAVEVAALMAEHLGGPLVPAALGILLQLSAGNPLHLHYLVLEQLSTRSLTEHEGVWVLANRGGLGDERLLGLLRTRIDRWTTAQREVLEFVALTEGLPFAQLDEIADSTAVENLLADGVIEIVGAADPSVRIRHRLVADVIRASVPFVRRRQLRTRVLPFLEDVRNGPSGSLLAYAAWTLECGVTLEPDLALRAATLANLLYDPEFALRAASAVRTAPHLFGATLQKSRAWRTLGMHTNAAQTLRRIDEAQRTELTAEQRVDLAVEFCEVAVVLPAEADHATAALAAARSAVPDLPASLFRRLDVAEWSLRIAEGGYLTVVDPLEAAYRSVAVAPTDHWMSLASLLAETLCALGRQTDALDILTELDEPLRSPALSDDVRDRAYSAVFVTLLKLGLWERNIHILTGGRDVRFGQELFRAGASASALGVNYIFGGRVNDGHQILVGALGQVRVRDSYNSRAQILSALAYSAALADDVAIAEKYLAELGDAHPSYGHTMSVAHYLALNAVAAIGNPEDARDRMLVMADGYRQNGQLIDEVLLLSSAARLGSTTALELLQHPRMSQPGPLALAIYEWAHGALAGDAPLLLHAATLLHELGNHLFAREAAMRVAETGRGAVAEAALRMVGDINAELQDGPSGVVHLRGALSLTKRERDVTALAAKGLTNREIAESLHLSVRTVESYLQAAFGKLGIGARTELAAAI